MNFSSLRNLQSEAAECGLACLAVAAQRAGSQIDLAWLRQRFPGSLRGMSMRQLSEVAHGIGMTTRAVRCEPEELDDLQLPAILHWGLQHYVVLEKVQRGKVRIFDPARGHVTVPMAELGLCFTGIALELAASPRFQRKIERPPFNPLSLIHWSADVKSGIVQALFLSLVLQVYLIASPLYIQGAVDSGALRGDKELLFALAAGFLLFALFNAGATAMRAVVLQRLGAVLSWDMSRRLFHHMIRLPLPWFEKRKLADTMVRFQAIEPIKALIATGLIGSVLDGVLSISMLALMFVYSLPLALVGLVGFLLSMAARFAALPMTLRFAGEQFRASIGEQSRRIETLRSIQTIKVMSGEAHREGLWANKQASLVKAQQNNGLATGLIGALQGLLDTATFVIIVYLGAQGVIAGSFTVGALYAFVSYRQQFASRAGTLVDTIINWRMLEVYNSRIADVVLTEPERGLETEPSNLPELKGKIELISAAYRYSPGKPMVFQNVSMTINAGEAVAIVGRSGCGKSTLLKAMCGLYPLSFGEVRVDGLPLSIWGPRAIRSSIGVVLQNDDLLPGSVLENVAFFDELLDVDRAWDCLEKAAIADEVRRLPMAEHTYVGDLGSSLSGGQVQRILLARALYKQPRFLVLDEATAHLDLDCENRINEYLRSADITRVIVAHRPSTIAAADRVFLLHNGIQDIGSGADYRARFEHRGPMRIIS
ncbi:peptidase domain-containing ABC transporter [Sphingomonas sp. HT-1]|uniref:peptidase domain-containing ABC transporter n=1 Tax=unclassified Sphingomonas TaxID=196159 RepID=UPI0002E56B33|nr:MULTISPECIES: peptidase domain-containing ABC transporter [unclassified Sphingomonas]KTF67507.1 ABC transporter ATP-binding protein [Sphingomonas sp. WG]